MQKLQLSLPEPCHENWQQMTPTEQGRFCNACAKEVIDFSTMTDIQVLNYFTNKTNEKVCGRALPEQLDRTLSRPEHPKKKIFWYWNYIVMFFMFFTKGNSAKAQSCAKPVTENSPVQKKDVRHTTAGGMQVTMEFLNQIRQGDVNESLSGKVGKVAVNNKIITGKVTDVNGDPIAFVSVKIKGTPAGSIADANGAYSLKVNMNAILIISGAGYRETEVPVGNLNVINTVLEKATGSFTEGAIVVTVGGIGFRDMDSYDGPYDKLKHVAVIHVKDETTGKPIPHASLLINDYVNGTDTFFTDKKGSYKIKGIKDDDEYAVKITAEGYATNEFTIDRSDFNDRKKEWEVLLKKKKAEAIMSSNAGKRGNENIVRLGQISSTPIPDKALYVVDGTINPEGMDINPDDIDNITILQGPAAAALFGPDGSNGAIVITTRKAKEKKLDTVTVTAYPVQGRLGQITTCTTSVMGGMMSGMTIRSGNKITDSLMMVANKITGAIKIYPNPVQRGQQFSIALKLKEAGLYQLQITNTAGIVVLQKQINANAKQVTEKVMPDSRWSAGIYYVSIINSKNQLTGKTSFIFE